MASTSESEEPVPVFSFPENERHVWEKTLSGDGGYTDLAAQIQEKLAQASDQAQRIKLYRALAQTLSYHRGRVISTGIIVSAILSSGPYKQEFEKLRDEEGAQGLDFFKDVLAIQAKGTRQHALQSAQATTINNWGVDFLKLAIAENWLDTRLQHFWDKLRAASRRVPDWKVALSMMNMIALNQRKLSHDSMDGMRSGTEIWKAEQFEGVKDGAECLTEEFARPRKIKLDEVHGVVRFENWDDEVVPAIRSLGLGQAQRGSVLRRKAKQARTGEQSETEQAARGLVEVSSGAPEPDSRRTRPTQSPSQQARRAREVDDSAGQTSAPLVGALQAGARPGRGPSRLRQAEEVDNSSARTPGRAPGRTSGQLANTRQSDGRPRQVPHQLRPAREVEDSAERSSGQRATARQARARPNQQPEPRQAREVADSAEQTSAQLGNTREMRTAARNSRQYTVASRDVHPPPPENASQPRKRQAAQTPANAPAGENSQRHSPKRQCVPSNRGGPQRRSWSEELQRTLANLDKTLQISSGEPRIVGLITGLQASRFQLARYLLGSGVEEAKEWSPDQIGWSSQGQNRDREGVDIWNLTVEQICRLADSDESGFEKPIIVRTCDLSFVKSQLLDVILSKTTKSTPVSVLENDGKGPSLMELPTAVARIRQGLHQPKRQYNPLEILSIPKSLFLEGRPDFLSHPRFSLLDIMASRLRRKKPDSPTDIEDSQDVYSLSSHYAHTDFHQDPYGCTWVKCLTGIKAFFFVKSDSEPRNPRKPDPRQMYGVLLRPGDILFMPGDMFLTYAVVTLEGPCLVVGGQTLDRRSLLPQLRHMFGFTQQGVKREARVPAAQLPDLVEELVQHFEEDRTTTDWSALVSELRTLQRETTEELPGADMDDWDDLYSWE